VIPYKFAALQSGLLELRREKLRRKFDCVVSNKSHHAELKFCCAHRAKNALIRCFLARYWTNPKASSRFCFKYRRTVSMLFLAHDTNLVKGRETQMDFF